MPTSATHGQRGWLLGCALAMLCMLLLAGEHLAARFHVADADFCGLIEGWGCRETIQHPWASVLNLPVALWAVSLYAVLIQLGPATWHRRAHRRQALLLLAALCTGTLAFLFLMERDFTDPCPLCLGAHTCHLFLAGIALAAVRAQRQQAAPQAAGEPGKLTLTPALLVLLAGMTVANLAGRVDMEQSLAGQLTDPALLGPLGDRAGDRYFPERLDQIIAGRPAAANRLTIVGSLSCRHCRALLAEVRSLPATALQATAIAFVPYPLAAACNPAAAKAGLPAHPQRCRLAAATNRAQSSSGFWPWFAKVNGAPGRTLRGMDSAAVAEVGGQPTLAAQIAAANAIPVARIPLLLWNGQPLPGILTRLPLAELISHLVDAQRSGPEATPEDCDC